MRLWAVVKLQRIIRRYLRRKRRKQQGRAQEWEARQRWLKKLQGPGYRPSPQPQPSEQRPSDAGGNTRSCFVLVSGSGEHIARCFVSDVVCYLTIKNLQKYILKLSRKLFHINLSIHTILCSFIQTEKRRIQWCVSPGPR